MGRNTRAPPPVEVMPLHDAARNGNVEEITRLLAVNPACINDRDRHSRTPILVAYDAAGIKLHCFVGCADRYDWEKFKLHMAAWAGQTEAVRLLCDRKADIRAAAGDDMAAIHFASQKGHIEAVRVLLAARADVNSLTRKSVSPLHMAVQGNHKDLCVLLIKKGANLLTKNKAGKTPVDLAKDEELGSCLKAAEVERRALKDAKTKPQTKESSEGETGNKQDYEAGASDAEPTAGVKREGSGLLEKVVDGEPNEEESAELKGSRKKAKVGLSHLDTDEAEEET